MVARASSDRGRGTRPTAPVLPAPVEVPSSSLPPRGSAQRRVSGVHAGWRGVWRAGVGSMQAGITDQGHPCVMRACVRVRLGLRQNALDGAYTCACKQDKQARSAWPVPWERGRCSLSGPDTPDTPLVVRFQLVWETNVMGLWVAALRVIHPTRHTPVPLCPDTVNESTSLTVPSGHRFMVRCHGCAAGFYPPHSCPPGPAQTTPRRCTPSPATQSLSQHSAQQVATVPTQRLQARLLQRSSGASAGRCPEDVQPCQRACECIGALTQGGRPGTAPGRKGVIIVARPCSGARGGWCIADPHHRAPPFA